MITSMGTQPDSTTAAANLISYLETGVAPEGLFSPTVFGDVSLPHWRVQSETAQALIAIRAQDHPFPGEVRVERIEHTGHGFTMEFEERWHHDGQRWYCREMIRADVEGTSIVALSVYCTGDWDEARQREHAEAVQLVRP